jgi:hypothetical protein
MEEADVPGRGEEGGAMSDTTHIHGHQLATYMPELATYIPHTHILPHTVSACVHTTHSGTGS